MSIQETEFQVFITSVKHYFKQICGTTPEFMPPYILDDKIPLQGFTGAIRVSGNYNGTVYFSCNADLLTSLLECIGDPRRDDEALRDCVGEVANTISGNFRRDYGSQFVISTPTIKNSEGKNFKPAADSTTYVAPVNWNGSEAVLIVDLRVSKAAA